MAAPGRRRRIYRSLQIIMMVCLVAGPYLHSRPELLSKIIGTLLIMGGPALWCFGGIYSWRRPSRILLLRPFQAKKVSRPLKRWLRVGSARSYHFLQNRLARRFTMNMFWQCTFTKLLKVKCSDTWWKQCVDLLMYSCHLIVVDLSWVKVGTEWELDNIDRRDLERKTDSVVGEDAADYAHDVIARFWPHEEAPPPLYVYRNSGELLEREAFERDVARMISESHVWQGVQEESNQPVLSTI